MGKNKKPNRAQPAKGAAPAAMQEPTRPALKINYAELLHLIGIYEQYRENKSYVAVLSCFIDKCGANGQICNAHKLNFGDIVRARQFGGGQLGVGSKNNHIAKIKSWAEQAQASASATPAP
jgi:hypothetical protein